MKNSLYLLFTLLASALVGLSSAAAEGPKTAKLLNGTNDPDAWRGPHALIYSYSGDGAMFCSGTLIGKNIVLTAAHCLVEGRELEVIVGGYSWPIKATFRNKKFNIANESPTSAQIREDLGIIVLTGDVFGAKPIPVIYKLSPRIGQKVTYVGYGLSDIPLEGPDDLVSHASIGHGTIGDVYDGYFTNRVTYEGAAVAATEYSTTCPGDSGGTVLGNESSTSYIMGTISAGYNHEENGLCMFDDETGGIGAYVDLSSFEAQTFLGQFATIQWISGTDIKFKAEVQKTIATLQKPLTASSLKSARSSIAGIRLTRGNSLTRDVTALKLKLSHATLSADAAINKKSAAALKTQAGNLLRRIKVRVSVKRSQLL